MNKYRGKTTKMSQIWIQTSTCQLLITYQTKVLTTWFLNLPPDESIDNKKTKFKSQIQDPMKHS
jgi:hypothetical protein